MEKLNITSRDHWSYDFGLTIWKDMPVVDKRCPYCYEVSLDPIYTYIITQLKKAGLLDKTYKEICCYCAVLQKMGMIQHVHDVEGIYYGEETDILEIEIFMWENVEGFKKLHMIPYRVHDWSKIGGK